MSVCRSEIRRHWKFRAFWKVSASKSFGIFVDYSRLGQRPTEPGVAYFPVVSPSQQRHRELYLLSLGELPAACFSVAGSTQFTLRALSWRGYWAILAFKALMNETQSSGA